MDTGADFTVDQALDFLRKRNVNIQEFVGRPEVFERTCTVVYKALPLPVRMAVGKKRIRKVLGAAREVYLAQGPPPDPETPGGHVSSADTPVAPLGSHEEQEGPVGEGRAALSDAQRRLNEYQQTGDEHMLFAAASEATGILARTPSSSDLYAPALSVTGQAFFTWFRVAGDFAALDCALTVMGRLSQLPEADSYGLPTGVTVANDQWDETRVSRAVGDSRWTILHPDGRVSHLEKDWSGWHGEGWPTGWKITAPNGDTLEFEEGHFGDGWRILEMESEPREDSADADADSISGFFTIGDARHSFSASPSGLTHQPVVGGQSRHVPASDVAVVRVMSLGDNRTFVMLASSEDPDDVCLSFSLWGESGVERAASIASIFKARTLLATDP